MEKFNNKYRIESVRLQSWDYAANGAYFITICTQDRLHFFGDIVEPLNLDNSTNEGRAVMKLNKLGDLATKYWLEIPNHFPFVELANFVVMPNHTHGILIINNDVEPPNTAAQPRPNLSGSTNFRDRWKPNTIGSIINQYKRIVTINARKIQIDFAWQSRFYDHIIRNEESFENIQKYITNNPKNWKKDKFYR